MLIAFDNKSFVMKNIVGQTPRGDNFFPREKLIKQIYRRLEGGSTVFLSAPRRVGKTSIMRFLQDHSEESYHFIYITTESVDSTEEFFRKLLEELLRDDIVKKISSLSERSKKLINDLLGRVKSLNIPGFSVEIAGEQGISYQAEFEELLTKIDTQSIRVVIMIDEFPQTLENIRQKSGPEDAKDFLRANRGIRQKSSEGIQFIYTGSIGLPIVVKKLDSLELINDLNIVEVPPLSVSEAKNLLYQLFKEYGVHIEPSAVEHLIKKIHWLIPFHLQLAAQEIIDIYEVKAVTISSQHVDQAFERITNSRNDVYFDSYYSRLKKSFSPDQLAFTLDLLSQLASKDEIHISEITSLAKQHNSSSHLDSILESLTYDGYINNLINHDVYRFNSSILKMWWKKYKSNK